MRAHAIRLLGEIAAHRDPPDVANAEGRYRRRSRWPSDLGMRPLVAHCHLGLAKLSPNGPTGAGAGAPGDCATMYREMGMGFWLEQAEAEIQGLT